MSAALYASEPMNSTIDYVTDRFSQVVGSLDNENVTTDKLKTLWDEAWTSASDYQLPHDHSSSEVQSGETLTASYNSADVMLVPYDKQMDDDALVDVVSVEDQRGQILAYSVAVALFAKGSATWPELFASRKNSLPPKRGDILYASAVKSAAPYITNTRPLTSDELNAWFGMPSASNPIYRMLSLEVFPKICTDEAQFVQFLDGYLNESDSTIASQVIRAATALQNQSALSFLQNFESNQRSESRTEIADEALSAIELLQSYIGN